MALLSFERKLDSTIMRKRLDIQEALKRPMKGLSLVFFAVIGVIIYYFGVRRRSQPQAAGASELD